MGTGITAGAGLLILKSGTLRAATAPSNKLNMAVIGVGGRGKANLKEVKSENIVALCDVNEQHLATAAKEFPNAKTYADWRQCLDHKGLDAVVCATTDHTHAFVSTWAMNRGLHVYCEKPLASSVYEARTVRETYLKHKGKLATQMGTQIHATENYRRVVELIRGGVIGTIKDARAFCNRMPEGGTYLPEVTPVPSYINWDLWLGPAPAHPFNPKYIEGGCTQWNRFGILGRARLATWAATCSTSPIGRSI